MTKFELAESLIHNCQIQKAEQLLKQALPEYLENKNYEQYFRCYQLYVRTLAELEKYELIPKAIQAIEAQFINLNISPTPKMYYIRAYCASQIGQFQTAYELCEKALTLALQSANEQKFSDILYSLSGLVACNMMAFKKYDVALKQISQMQEILDKQENREIRVTSLLSLSKIYSILDNHELADRTLDQAKSHLRDQKSLLNHIIFLMISAENAIKKNLHLNAFYYFEFALNLCDPTELPFRYKIIKTKHDDLKSKYFNNNLYIDHEKKVAYEKNIGRIDFKNQFILFELLKTLIDKNSQPTTKDEISQILWNEKYNKDLHDNKIYVTIKRLRNLIEPHSHSTKYLFRSKDGYFLSQNNNQSSITEGNLK